jgi:hypothetical protein
MFCVTRLLAAALFAALVLAGPASAKPAEVDTALPGAEKVGDAQYRVFGIHLFNAALYTNDGPFSWQRPFALTLTYERAARQSTLVNRSINEMRQRGGGDAQTLAVLRPELERCFPNIARGDRITGVSTGPNSAHFFYNGAQRCAIEWPNFRRAFFGIWLAGRGGDARFSAELRGGV